MNLPISALLQATAGNAFYFHIKAGATDSKEVVFGTTVLEAFYVIVNYAEARVEFANKAGTDADTQALLAAEGQTLCAVVPTCGVATSYDEVGGLSFRCSSLTRAFHSHFTHVTHYEQLTNSCVELSRCPTTVFNIYDVDIRDCDIPALPKLIFFMLAVPTGLLELIAAYRARFLLRKIYSK